MEKNKKEEVNLILKRYEGTRTIPDVWVITAKHNDQEWGASISTNNFTRERFGDLLTLITAAIVSNTDKKVI